MAKTTFKNLGDFVYTFAPGTLVVSHPLRGTELTQEQVNITLSLIEEHKNGKRLLLIKGDGVPPDQNIAPDARSTMYVSNLKYALSASMIEQIGKELGEQVPDLQQRRDDNMAAPALAITPERKFASLEQRLATILRNGTRRLEEMQETTRIHAITPLEHPGMGRQMAQGVVDALTKYDIRPESAEDSPAERNTLAKALIDALAPYCEPITSSNGSTPIAPYTGAINAAIGSFRITRNDQPAARQLQTEIKDVFERAMGITGIPRTPPPDGSDG